MLPRPAGCCPEPRRCRCHPLGLSPPGTVTPPAPAGPYLLHGSCRLPPPHAYLMSAIILISAHERRDGSKASFCGAGEEQGWRGSRPCSLSLCPVAPRLGAPPTCLSSAGQKKIKKHSEKLHFSPPPLDSCTAQNWGPFQALLQSSPWLFQTQGHREHPAVGAAPRAGNPSAPSSSSCLGSVSASPP